ncbi:MAG: sigma-70 family RNA polymerase sigma factor [Alicyclobacillus sp.]|nr:sigma-70 family RNA polymerase sigma factor [Alicyclobacillus sp.]
MRQNYRTKMYPVERTENISWEMDASSEDFTQQVATEDALYRVLSDLPPHSAELLHLAFIEEMSYGEIAQVLGIPPGTVKSRVHHLRLQLRKRLQGEGNGT